MASKKSALSAALKGNAPPAPPKPDVKDINSFWQAQNDGSDSGSEDLASGIEHISLRGRMLAGSAPTAVLGADGYAQADYELNPYRRRGGQERMPTPSSSVDDKLRWKLLGSASLQSNFISDHLVGSLPSGLSVEERANILASTPLSPTLNLLSSVSLDKVSQRNAEGKRLRRHVLRGAVLVFITAGYSGKRFIFERARELGVRSVVLDGPESWSKGMEAEGIIDKFVPLDFSDTDTIFERCLHAIQKIRQKVGELDGICTFCEMAVPLAARLAEKLGLPGNSPASVDAARDKHATRAAMSAAGLPTPRNRLISSEEDVEAAAKHVGFPAVLKPIFGAASLGVVRVDGPEQLQAAYRRVQREMAGARVVAGALQAGDEDDGSGEAANGNAGQWIKTTLMMEEYLDGPEVDVDLVFSGGQAVYGAITDNWPTVEPYFNETGSNCPCILPSSQQAELMELAVASVQALGLTAGVFHVEGKYTSRGARLIEVNCRMGGGPVRATNLLVWGVDLVEEQLLAATGIPSRPPVARRPLAHLAEYSINAKKTGRLQHTDFMKEWEAHPDVLYARPLLEAGAKVTSVADGMPTWVAEFMVTKPTVQEAIAFAQQIEAAVEVPII